MPFPPDYLLSQWLESRLPEPAQTWLTEKRKVVETGDTKTLFLSFSMVPRKLGKADLQLSEQELADAEASRPGWDARNWSVDQAARTLLVLSFPADPEDPNAYVAVLDRLFQAAEMGEMIALYQALPLYPFPEAFALRAAEGIRTNMKTVFTAVAHHNPYPSEQLEQDRWNHMVLKCLFIGVKLAPIVGIDRRANPELASMLCEYAHERWAASRDISPELWRCVGPFAGESQLADLQRVLETGSELEKKAACLALVSAGSDEADQLLATEPELARAAESGKFTWDDIAAAI